MATVFLKPGREQRAYAGYLWIFAGEIARIDGQVEDGGIVDVRALRGQWIGRGFLNRNSTLTVRLLTFNHEEIDEAFFRRRLQHALALRHRVLGPLPSFRVVYGEADARPSHWRNARRTSTGLGTGARSPPPTPLTSCAGWCPCTRSSTW